jgi:hypothetical protein
MGDAAVGFFSAASRFSMVIATLTQIVYLAWQEEAFREAGSDSLQRYASEVMDIYNRVLFGGVVFGLPLLKLAVPYLINAKYAEAYALIPAVILTAVYSALSSFAGTVYSAKMKTDLILYTTLAGGILSFALSWFGVKVFGLQAVAAAGGVGFLLMFVLRVGLSSHAVPIKVNWGRFAALNAAAGAAVAVYFVPGTAVQLATAAAGFVLFFIINRKLAKTALQALVPNLQSGANLSATEEIIEGSEGLVRTWEATIQNLWEGARSGVDYQVLAGAAVDHPEQGLIVMIETHPDTLQRSQHFFLAPEKTGSLRILAVKGTRLTLRAASGSQWFFDLKSHKFSK